MARRDSILVSRTLYQLGIFTLITAVMWVAIGVYVALTVNKEVNVDKSLLEPINPVIDQEVINSLTNRLIIEESVVEPVVVESTPASESATIEGDGVR